MSSHRNCGQKQQTCSSMVILVASAVMFSVIVMLCSTPHIRAAGDSQSVQTICNDNQPCLTVVCSETQPCRALQSPHTDSDTANLEPLEDTGTMGLAPAPELFSNNDYWEDLQDYLEERHDIIEEANHK